MAERLRRGQGQVQALETARILQVAEAKFRTYVTGARFSHGMCEDCFREQHPDMVEIVEKGGG